MIPNIESLYARIGQAIFEMLPDEWTSASLTAIFYPDSISWEPEFVTPKGELLSFNISPEITMAFMELREQFKEAGQPLWGQATFVMDSQGKFNVKWGYDNCDENGATIWDADQWQRRQEERNRRLSG